MAGKPVIEQWLDKQSYSLLLCCPSTIGLPWHVQKGALTTAEVCEALGLGQLKNRSWHVQGAISIRGEGLYEGLDWYVAIRFAKLVFETRSRKQPDL